MTAPGDSDATAGGRRKRSRWPGGVALGLVLVLVVAELTVRIVGHDLPDPQVWSTPETQYKVDQIDRRGPVETVAIGSSVVDVSLEPDGLGHDAYNAALGAASIGMIDEFTRSVVLPRLDPEVVVVGLASRELNENAPEQRRIEQDFYDAPAVRRLLGTESILERLDRVAGDALWLVRYRSVLRDPHNWIDPGPAWDGTVTADDGLYLGFRQDAYHGSREVLRRFRDGALHGFHIGVAQLATLRGLLTDLQAQGRRVLLVLTPVTQDYIDAYPHGVADHEAFLTTVRRLARQVGIQVVEAGVWDTSIMADPLHPNGAGADRLTAMVADALARPVPD